MIAVPQIRPAQRSDAGVIAEFNIQLALETEHLRLDPSTVRAGVEAVLSHPAKGVYFLADIGEHTVGQCSITHEWSDWRNGMYWWLQSVYVKPAWRRRGTFRALFDHVHSAAAAAGAVGLRLYVERDNIPAQVVYQRHGLAATRYVVFERMLKAGPPG
jgi:GNAT superfamily N-acetyltransferase